MPILAIELTDEEYQTAQTLPASEQRRALLLAANQYATARNEAPDQNGVLSEDEPLTEADLAALQVSIDEEAAGKLVAGDALHSSIRSMLSARRAERSVQAPSGGTV